MAETDRDRENRKRFLTWVNEDDPEDATWS
jgi:hypothetical protein